MEIVAKVHHKRSQHAAQHRWTNTRLLAHFISIHQWHSHVDQREREFEVRERKRGVAWIYGNACLHYTTIHSSSTHTAHHTKCIHLFAQNVDANRFRGTFDRTRVLVLDVLSMFSTNSFIRMYVCSLRENFHFAYKFYMLQSNKRA